MPSPLYRTLVPAGSRRERWLWIGKVAIGKLREGPGPWWRAVKKGLFQSLPKSWQRNLQRGTLQRYRRLAEVRFAGPDAGVEIAGRVSVILPVKDQADLLAAAVASVLAQTHRDLELIVLDDGSSDDVAAALAPFRADARLRLLRQPNQGLPKALSSALECATGEFHTWTSADNVLHERHLERLVEFLRAHPEHAMVFADYELIDANGAPMTGGEFRIVDRTDKHDRAVVRADRPVDELNRIEDNFVGPCFLYRGRVGRLLGDYNPELGLEDYDYWMRMNRLFGIAHLDTDEVLYRYRVHDNTLSARARELRLIERAKALMAYERQREAWFAAPCRLATDRASHDWVANAVGPAMPVETVAADSLGSCPGQTLFVCAPEELPRIPFATLPATVTVAVPFASIDEAWRFGEHLRHAAVVAFGATAEVAARLAVFSRIVFAATPGPLLLELALRRHVDHTFFTVHRSATERERAVPAPLPTIAQLADEAPIAVVRADMPLPSPDAAPKVRAWLADDPALLADLDRSIAIDPSLMVCIARERLDAASQHLAQWLQQGGSVPGIRAHLRRLGDVP